MMALEGTDMPEVGDRRRTAAPPEATARRARPVVLATLSVRVHPAAEEMAIASALEAGVPLIVANLLHLPPYPATVVLAGPAAATLPHEEALEEVRATAAHAAALGIRTELLRVSTRRPVRASTGRCSGSPGRTRTTCSTATGTGWTSCSPRPGWSG